jgi:hypothetical protein
LDFYLLGDPGALLFLLGDPGDLDLDFLGYSFAFDILVDFLVS